MSKSKQINFLGGKYRMNGSMAKNESRKKMIG